MSAQTQTQTVFVSSTINDLKFSFLSQPPQSKRRVAPSAPLPPPPGSLPPVPTTTTPRANAFSNIVAWAALVQPGSPAPITPPHRRTSISRRPSIGRLVDIQKTPTTAGTIEFDLTTLGYTSLFVHLPKTPTTPSPYLRPRRSRSRSGATCAVPLKLSPKATAYAHIPVPPIPTEAQQPKRKLGMKRIRSLTILRPRTAKSTQPPPSPTKTAKSSKSAKVTSAAAASGRPRSQSQSQTSQAVAANIAKRKRAKYANVRPPPPLANELALMQFADGGSMDANIKRVMEAQAKAAAGSAAGGAAAIGVSDVYRDGKGGVWWDADEEMEYAHLLDGATADDQMVVDDWVAFGSAAAPADKENQVPVTEERRSSVTSVDSELDPANLMPLPENEPTGLNAPVNDRVLASQRIGVPGMSVLSLPCRPRREARHLRRAEFLIDKGAFGAFIPRSPINVTFDAAKTKSKPRGKARRRPAPLKLVNSAHHTVKVVVATNGSPGGAEKARREFLDSSFKPLPLTPVHNSPVVHVHLAPEVHAGSQRSLGMSKKPSRLNMRAFFSRRGD
ncbi:hypothetical protein BJ165DRAFT_1522049 [Panaeolus papilionaceus]|nr:hypothetical protein BJ165DRAFT_1522049 [Panaeolus papilionaceus]